MVGMFLPLSCIVDWETSNGLMPAAEKFMILNRLLIVPGVEQAIRNIGVNLCLLVLRPSAARESHNAMSAPGIL